MIYVATFAKTVGCLRYFSYFNKTQFFAYPITRNSGHRYVPAYNVSIGNVCIITTHPFTRIYSQLGLPMPPSLALVSSEMDGSDGRVQRQPEATKDGQRYDPEWTKYMPPCGLDYL